jgi:hypothetical protein
MPDDGSGVTSYKEFMLRMIKATDERVVATCEGLVPALVATKTRSIEQRLDQRVDQLFMQISKVKSGPQQYVATLERHLTEMAGYIKALEDKVRVLEGKVK